MTPASGDAFLLQVTAVWLDAQKRSRVTDAQLKDNVEKAAAGPLAQAEETSATLQQLSGASAVGYYFSLTDKNPPPEEYKYLTQGTLRVGECMVVFTLLRRVPDDAVLSQTLEMLAAAQHVP